MEQLKSEKDFFHIIHCDPMKEVKINLSNNGKKHMNIFSVIGISSKEKIITGLKSVKKSPFKTVFVVSPESGKVLFAITQNEAYLASAKKEKRNLKIHHHQTTNSAMSVLEVEGNGVNQT